MIPCDPYHPKRSPNPCQETLAPFRELNAGNAWPGQVKPFNFLLVGHVRPFGHSVDVDPARFQPIAPYESDPSKWGILPWIDRYSGQRYRVGAADEWADPDVMQLQTYRDVVREFRIHPEAKSANANGQACVRRTVGLLQRRVVRDSYVAHIGKEANKLEEVEAGLENDQESIYTEHLNPSRDEWETVILPHLQVLNAKQVASAIGISTRVAYSLLSGDSLPRPSTRRMILSQFGDLF